MKEQFVESAAAWFLLGLTLGICIAVFVNMVFSFKNIEINDLKKQIQSKDLEMISLENDNKMLKENLNELLFKYKDFEKHSELIAKSFENFQNWN